MPVEAGALDARSNRAPHSEVPTLTLTPYHVEDFARPERLVVVAVPGMDFVTLDPYRLLWDPRDEWVSSWHSSFLEGDDHSQSMPATGQWTEQRPRDQVETEDEGLWPQRERLVHPGSEFDRLALGEALGDLIRLALSDMMTVDRVSAIRASSDRVIVDWLPHDQAQPRAQPLPKPELPRDQRGEKSERVLRETGREPLRSDAVDQILRTSPEGERPIFGERTEKHTRTSSAVSSERVPGEQQERGGEGEQRATLEEAA